MNVEKAIKILRDTGVGTKLDYRYSAETLNAVKKTAIQALQAQAERRWIPVSERLPEDGRTILTYTLGGNIEVFLYDSSTYQPVWYGVTHWMPLPEPPKE